MTPEREQKIKEWAIWQPIETAVAIRELFGEIDRLRAENESLRNGSDFKRQLAVVEELRWEYHQGTDGEL